jgi:hypothetical protein
MLAIVLLGVTYAAIGILFAIPTTHVRAWRLAAWAASAVVYTAHTAYEGFRRRSSPFTAAAHVALAVALGGLGLALEANLHSLSHEGTDAHRRLLFLALGIWPILTGLPAFLVALVAEALLVRAFRSASDP